MPWCWCRSPCPAPAASSSPSRTFMVPQGCPGLAGRVALGWQWVINAPAPHSSKGQFRGVFHLLGRAPQWQRDSSAPGCKAPCQLFLLLPLLPLGHHPYTGKQCPPPFMPTQSLFGNKIFAGTAPDPPDLGRSCPSSQGSSSETALAMYIPASARDNRQGSHQPPKTVPAVMRHIRRQPPPRPPRCL